MRWRVKEKYYKSIMEIHSTVRLGEVILDKKNIKIMEHTYIRSGEIAAGEAKVTIGKNCAIGKNVSIRARTHDPLEPTLNDSTKIIKKIYKDIKIGDHVWIGNNVYIKEGVTIGDHVIIGANSVVTKNIGSGHVVGGVPAKILESKDHD